MILILCPLGLDYISRKLYKKDIFSIKYMEALIYYWIMIVVIGLLIYNKFKLYDYVSFWYHLLILFFPLFLIILNKENIKNLGFKIGNYKYGICVILFFTIFMILGNFLKANLLNKNVYFYHDFYSLYFIYIVFTGPITEELFLRYTQFKFSEINFLFGIFSSAVMGSLLHIPKFILYPNEILFLYFITQQFDILLMFLNIFIILIIIGIIYHKTNSIFYPIIFHSIYNLILWVIRF